MARPRRGETVTVPGPLCEARGVKHEFVLPSGRRVHVLESVDLAIQPEEVVAILGPSGCGKSTVIRILAGLIRPTQGEVLYRGAPLEGLNPAVAIVFQSFALYPWMTVAENIEAVLKARGLPADEVARRVERVVRLVGLTGSEGDYPRELSGGMKQRAGMARALSVDPEILFMDEPFSQVDALTAESLRAEVIDIWSGRHRNPSSILMVSHDIHEVAFMADRIIIMSAHPGRVRTVVENRIPRPRDYRSPEFQHLVDELHDIITGHELPDVTPPAIPIEPIPEALPGEIVGLLEYLDARGGSDDVFRIVATTNREFGHVITVVQAAELLGFVDTPRRTVVLESEGRRFLAASVPARKEIWRERLRTLRLFQEIEHALDRDPRHRLDRDFLLEMIALHLPHEDPDRMCDTAIRWALAGDHFGYDDDTEVLTPFDTAARVR